MAFRTQTHAPAALTATTDSSFLQQSHSTAAVAAAAAAAAHAPRTAADPPLMPLFTPVLQDFQHRFGSSSILQQSSRRNSKQDEDDDDDDDDDDGPPDFHEQPQDYNTDDEDEDEEPEFGLDPETSSRRNLLYNHGSGPSSSLYASDTGRAKDRLLFGGTTLQRPSSSPSTRPSALGKFPTNHGGNRSVAGQHPRMSRGGGGISRLGPSHDLGTDHEAPASLMIEMNHQQQDEDDNPGYWNFGDRARRRLSYKRPGMDAAELAMWKWVNVENLDNFLTRVYDYYVGKGMYTILLERCLNLLTFAFVIGFATFLVGCVDYPRLRHSKHMDELLVPQCFHRLSTGTVVVLLLFAIFWVGQLTRLIYDVPEMVDMCNFYTYLLQIPDEDIQTVSWHEVVSRIIKIRDNNPNTTTAATIQTTDMQRLNAHDIANRIMRKENFMIAMFNKDLIDLSPPVPLLRNRTILTRILQWSLSFCILGYVFDERGQVRKRFLKDTRRNELVDGLRRRFQFMGLATILFSPLISIYLMLYFFFRYFEEYHKNPSSIGTRQYTPLAKWKFKEFNELPHLFDDRINASYPLAMKYINQFPKEKTILVCRFVAFISGSFAAVLALMTLFDQELLLGLEITPEKTVFFYLGLFGTIMAVSRGMIPDQTESFDPELLLRGVVEHTHYMPNEWRDKLHTDEVRKQFALLFEYNAVLFLLEFMSLILTPLILCLSLPSCSEKVIDFFREFTVHVDGVGYVCSFAVFDFKRHGNVKYGAPADSKTEERFVSNEGKMEKSFLNFKQNNPDWEPHDPEGSMYLSKLLDADAAPAHGRTYPNQHHYYGDPFQPPLIWGQSSAFLRPRNSMGASSYFNYADRGLYRGKSRLGGGVHTRNGGDSQDDSNDDQGDSLEHGRHQGPGVKFYLSSTQRHRRQRNIQDNGRRPKTGSESSEYDEPDSQQRQRSDHGQQSSLGLGFTTSLGDSFVSEIGQSSSQARTSGGRREARRGEGKGQSKGLDGATAEELSDVEDERESRKKGVFGLLNQIYEMNTVTM
ncbi:autophagy protein atg9 [Mortierella claussenii]|nr:autophagy protein atg9 [Mortierella claussenii]